MDIPFHSSGALSREHYAIVRKVESASSSVSADQEICLEIKRLKDLLHDPHLTNSRRKEYLIILLYCAMSVSAGVLEHDAFSFAFLHAINLAETGKNTSEKGTGYAFCAEMLPLDHELRLMLINTIRKDLESSEPARICLALKSLIESPTEDVVPAVESCLHGLISHPSPSVRRRTFLAFRALARFSTGLLGRICDPVLSALKDADEPVFPAALTVGPDIAKEKGMRRKLISKLNKVLEKEISYSLDANPWIIVQILSTLKAIGLSETSVPLVLDILGGLCELQHPTIMQKAVVLESLVLLSQADPSKLIEIQKEKHFKIAQCIRPLLVSQRVNDVNVFTSCLLHLPVSSWAGTKEDFPPVFDTFEFERILQLLNSADAGIRGKALVIVVRVDPAILDAHFGRLLDMLSDKSADSNLSVILQLLEVLSVRYRADGGEYAAEVLKLIDRIEGSMHSAHISDVVAAVLNCHPYDTKFRNACAERFSKLLVEPDALLGMMKMVTTVALITECPDALRVEPSEIITTLGSKLASCPTNVQHVCILAMLRIRALCDTVPAEAIENVKEAAKSPHGPLKLCCDLFLEFVDKKEELLEVVNSHNVSTLPEFFEAVSGSISGRGKDKKTTDTVQSATPESSQVLRSPKLRYKAYDAPKYTPRLQERRNSSSRHSVSSARSDTSYGRRHLGSPPMTAGDLTLAAGLEDLSISMKATSPSLLRVAKSKNAGYDLITLDTPNDPFSPFEAGGPELTPMKHSLDFEEVWNTIGGTGDARGWSQESMEKVIRSLQGIEGRHLRVISTDVAPFIGEVKILITGADERGLEGVAVRLKETDEDGCLWRVRCLREQIRTEIVQRVNSV